VPKAHPKLVIRSATTQEITPINFADVPILGIFCRVNGHTLYLKVSNQYKSNCYNFNSIQLTGSSKGSTYDFEPNAGVSDICGVLVIDLNDPEFAEILKR